MAKFTDRFGHDWDVTITAGDLKRIKKEAGVDLRDALKSDNRGFAEKLDSNESFLDLMWAICAEQASDFFEPQTVTIDDKPVVRSRRDQFERAFDRDASWAAVAAVWEAVWDFFRGQKAGTAARRTLLASAGEIENVTATLLDKATERIKAGPTSKDGASGSPGSSGLTTDRTPYAS